MPVYEYACGKCGRIKEVMQKISDPPLTRCDACSGKLQRIISHSSFHLKGTGWYVTDYAAKSKAGAAKKETEKGQHSDKTSESKASGKAPENRSDE